MAGKLETPIKFVKGIGPHKAEVLAAEVEIETVGDLLHYYPYKYIDRSSFKKIRELDSTSSYVQIKGMMTSFEYKGEGRARRLIATFNDGSDEIDLVFFGSSEYITREYKLNYPYIIFGKPSCRIIQSHYSPWNNFGNDIYEYSFVNPSIEPINEQAAKGFMPVYGTTEKMKKKQLATKGVQRAVFNALQAIGEGDVPETLPAALLEKYRLPGHYKALCGIHFPEDTRALDAARRRFKFEELFYIQLAILKQAVGRADSFNHKPFEKVGDHFNEFYAKYLSFELTGAQKKVIKEIRADLRSDRQMNRLLQGDVGSGKTMVAMLTMLIAIDNGYQSVIVAPTEILANQHFESIASQLGSVGVNVRLLTGSTKKKEREEIAAGLADGSIGVLVGTHAVFEEYVRFKNLGLAIIDEQHRFGVAQRARLWAKSDSPPHVLVMSATPIPRTLAMTLYGDLEVSVIDELPPGRKPVRTAHVYEERRGRIDEFLRRELALGRQVYVVYPLIEKSEKSDLKDLEEGFEYYKEHFPDYASCMVHGKMKPRDKDEQMQRFVSGECRILVSTTVIEVGVNVPNASVMLIEEAQRFGLSQIHQLRGRVGRGADQSYCMLVTPYRLSEITKKRIDIICSSNDGFEIAEADLKLRGPGDIDGTQQSGLPFDLRIADITRDADLLQIARNEAQDILARDPGLVSEENSFLAVELKRRSKTVVNWSSIS